MIVLASGRLLNWGAPPASFLICAGAAQVAQVFEEQERFVAILVSSTTALPHDASHWFSERLLVHVEEHGADGWRDCVQYCGSHTEYML